jgi:hypothetical protein
LELVPPPLPNIGEASTCHTGIRKAKREERKVAIYGCVNYGRTAKIIIFFTYSCIMVPTIYSQFFGTLTVGTGRRVHGLLNANCQIG